MSPSVAALPLFLAARACPLSLRTFLAPSTSPSDSSSARFTSIIPAAVSSRSCLIFSIVLAKVPTSPQSLRSHHPAPPQLQVPQLLVPLQRRYQLQALRQLPVQRLPVRRLPPRPLLPPPARTLQRLRPRYPAPVRLPDGSLLRLPRRIPALPKLPVPPLALPPVRPLDQPQHLARRRSLSQRQPPTPLGPRARRGYPAPPPLRALPVPEPRCLPAPLQHRPPAPLRRLYPAPRCGRS